MRGAKGGMMKERRLKAPSPVLVVSLIALFVALGGGAAAASAKPASGDTISVQGHVIGSETVIHFSFSGSPLSELKLYGGPTFQFTGINVTDPQRKLPTKCSVTQTPNSAGCDFGLNPVPYANVDAGFTGQTPTTVTGWVMFGDGNTATFTAPISIVTEPPGNPAVTQSYATGMKRGRPQFYFSLSAYQGGSAITAFTVAFPHGMSLPRSTGTLHEHWNGVSFTCTRQTRHRIGCHSKTPFGYVSPHFGPSMLVESKALQTLVKKHRVMQLPITFAAIDEVHQVTYQHVTTPIKN